MAIMVIWASPNDNGLTAMAKNKVLEGIISKGGEAEVLNLNKCNIKRCLTCGDGWGTCRSEGKCTISDDFSDIYKKLVEADGIVWITPVYYHDLAECLKCFLDRLRRCERAHNNYLKGKGCLLVACAGGSGNGAIECLRNFEDTLNHMGMIAVDRLPVTRLNQNYMLPALSGAGQTFVTHLLYCK